jgi:hypothetical protein
LQINVGCFINAEATTFESLEPEMKQQQLVCVIICAAMETQTQTAKIQTQTQIAKTQRSAKSAKDFRTSDPQSSN